MNLKQTLEDIENKIFSHKAMNDEAQKPVGQINPPDQEAEKKDAPIEPKVESLKEVSKPEAEGRSAYNCPDCKGEGLKDENTLCPNCHGTGKI